MAYIYNEDPNEDVANNVATNIFQGQTGGGSQATPAQSGGGAAPTQDTSSTVGAGSNNTQAASSQGRPSESASSSKEVVRRNADKMQSPINIGAVRGDISNAKNALQQEADNFTSSQQKAGQEYSQANVQDALRNGGDIYGALQSRLTEAAPQYKEFTPQTKTDFNGKLNEISDNSLRNYFKTANGPSTSLGDAAFDTMLLNKNKQFKQERAQAQQEAQTLSKNANELVTSTNDKGRSDYQQSYDTGTANLRNQALAELDQVRRGAEEPAAVAEAERAKYANMSAPNLMKNTPGYKEWLYGLANQVGDMPEQRNALRQAIDQGLGLAQSDTGGLSLAGNVGVNPAMNFVNVGQAPITANNYLSPALANELNRGYKLLGTKAPAFSAAGTAAAPYSFNSNAAKAYLGNILGKQTAETQAQEQKDTEFTNAVVADREKQIEALGRYVGGHDANMDLSQYGPMTQAQAMKKMEELIAENEKVKSKQRQR